MICAVLRSRRARRRAAKPSSSSAVSGKLSARMKSSAGSGGASSSAGVPSARGGWLGPVPPGREGGQRRLGLLGGRRDLVELLGHRGVRGHGPAMLLLRDIGLADAVDSRLQARALLAHHAAGARGNGGHPDHPHGHEDRQHVQQEADHVKARSLIPRKEDEQQDRTQQPQGRQDDRHQFDDGNGLPLRAVVDAQRGWLLVLCLARSGAHPLNSGQEYSILSTS